MNTDVETNIDLADIRIPDSKRASEITELVWHTEPPLHAEYSDAEPEAVVHAHPRTEHFREDIIQVFYDGIKHNRETNFGNVKGDVLADKDPHFTRGNFCSVIRGSAWRG